MIVQYAITSAGWTAITASNESCVAWLDDDNEQSGDKADVRILQSNTIPSNATLSLVDSAARVTRRRNNNDFFTGKPRDKYLYYARCKTAGETALLSVDTNGIGVNIVQADAVIQNKTNFPIEYFLTQKIQNVVLSAPVAIESHFIDLVAGHGFVTGDHIEIKYVDSTLGVKRFFQGEVIAVNTNRVTVMPSVDFDIIVANIESAKRTTSKMETATTASIAAPIEFDVSPMDNVSFNITGITIAMILSTAADDGLFGNITKLPNGMYFGFERKIGAVVLKCLHIANIRDNSEIRLYCGAPSVVYTTRSGGGGNFGLSADKELNGPNNYDVIAILRDTNDRLYVSIHDNLTGLVSLRMKVRGYLVGD